MSWLSLITSVITAAFPASKKQAVQAPPGLEGARVTYVNEGRSGRVVFHQGLKSFEMYFEFGGGDTLATIDVPSEAGWSKVTGFPLDMRRNILDYIAKCVVRDQTTRAGGRFQIHENYISIHT